MNTPISNVVSRQKGLALFIALALLLITTIIGLAAVRSGLMESQMAVNEEMRANTFETTQSTVDAMLANTQNTQVIGGLGRKVCSASWTPSTGCEPDISLTLPAILVNAQATGNVLSAAVERLPPLLGPAPRGLGYSVEKFKAAHFRISAHFNGTATGYGDARIVQGSLVLVPVSSQTN